MKRKNRKFSYTNRSLGVDWSSKEARATYAREWRAKTKSAPLVAPKIPDTPENPRRPQHKFFQERPLQLRCHHCAEEKDFTSQNFNRDKSYRFGLATTCRVCLNKRKRDLGHHKWNLAQKFGVTPEMYDTYVRKGRCHICGLNEPLMAIDHCHKNGHARGVLCRGCNTGLGGFKDNPLLLEAAISYLRKT